jgi:RpiB/LacA/LacB family sugar-phosphate isomerase
MLKSNFPMRISIGADHAGFLLKESLRQKLIADGHAVTDRGADSELSCDYPVFAAAVAHDVSRGASDRGVLICGSGVGMQIAANKIEGIRAALGTSEEQVRLMRGHNDVNVLTLGARTTDPPAAARMVTAFLDAEFEKGRHSQRIAQIAELERSGKGAE